MIITLSFCTRVEYLVKIKEAKNTKQLLSLITAFIQYHNTLSELNIDCFKIDNYPLEAVYGVW